MSFGSGDKLGKSSTAFTPHTLVAQKKKEKEKDVTGTSAHYVRRAAGLLILEYQEHSDEEILKGS